MWFLEHIYEPFCLHCVNRHSAIVIESFLIRSFSGVRCLSEACSADCQLEQFCS
jgi:hypothetical protein